MKNIIVLVAASGAGYWLYREYEASKFYGAPMFSAQLQQLRDQDSGLV